MVLRGPPEEATARVLTLSSHQQQFLSQLPGSYLSSHQQQFLSQLPLISPSFPCAAFASHKLVRDQYQLQPLLELQSEMEQGGIFN
ncbi:hypothetical protein OIU77_019592 [Salix suchowensis]|uniref:Uncharacterized protein n=1 Tax=Salix suchowensis TaxID=1278906 RepID=A0ABQ9CK65_9ROSI|nr:hypothetical protein OIU77_019592 [Salix suchowensis]